MGKVVKTVLKVAAVAAIAVFAPPLAAAIAPSIGLGTALGTTVLAAGLGAGAGELSGVGWKAGLMAGGLSGGSSSGLFGGGAPAAGNVGAAAPPAADTGFLQQATGGSLGPAGAGVGAVGGVVPAAPATLGGTLSSFASNPLGTLGGGINNLTRGLGGALGSVGIGSGGGLNLGAIAPNLIAAGLVGNPGGAMAKAQEQELMRAQQVNAALTQQRLDEANKLISDAAYYDPEYMGRQAAEAAMIKGGIQTADQTRGLTGERLAAERRRMRLGTARTAGTAYQQGYGTGVGARTETRKAGISAIPTAYPMTDASAALNTSNAADRRRAEQEAGLSKMFGQVLGQRPSLASLTPSAQTQSQ